MTEVSNHYEVLIVGAGPTGLTIANILGMHGVRTLLVERNAATVAEPRAVSIDDESLRTMQYIDLIDEVRKTIIAGYGSYYFSPRGSCFAKVVPDVVDYGYPRRSAFRQQVLEGQVARGSATILECGHTILNQGYRVIAGRAGRRRYAGR